jgi:hypothetical protein
MPCDDITEVLTMVLDDEDRVVRYALRKRTCGRAVGEESLLAKWVAGRRVADLQDTSIDDLLAALPTDDEALEFLHLKHFFALRLGLAALTGQDDGGPGSPCAVASVSCGPDGLVFEGEVAVAVVTEQIKSCGRCGKGCGKAGASRLARGTTPG